MKSNERTKKVISQTIEAETSVSTAQIIEKFGYFCLMQNAPMKKEDLITHLQDVVETLKTL